MENNLLEQTKQYCHQLGFQPSKFRGQNFLVGEKIFDQIIELAGLSSDGQILEVGAGFGFLTEKIACQANRVLAVELDHSLADFLSAKYRKQSKISILQQDILAPVTKELLQTWLGKNKNYKIVANLPYSITGHFLRQFLTSETKPSEMILMLQKEVAERITAKPPQMSKLAVLVQFYGQPEILFPVSKDNFYPKPKVDSAVIKIKNIQKPSGIDEKKFFDLVQAGFSSPRKYLLSNLANANVAPLADLKEKFIQLGFSPKIRAQELSVEDWKRLL